MPLDFIYLILAVENGLCTYTWWRLRTWVFEVQTQSQRRDVAQRAIRLRGGGYERWGSGEKFSDGEISKTTTVGTPLR